MKKECLRNLALIFSFAILISGCTTTPARETQSPTRSTNRQGTSAPRESSPKQRETKPRRNTPQAQTMNPKQRIEEALPKLASKITTYKPTPQEMYSLLESYLKNYPQIAGAAFAYTPMKMNKREIRNAPYVYRRNGRLVRDNAAANNFVYEETDWYAEAVINDAPQWSDPYYRLGDTPTKMITYSMPVYADRSKTILMGVVTSDLLVQ